MHMLFITESSKKGNEELHEGVSADIRTVVQDNININIKIHQNVTPKYSMDECKILCYNLIAIISFYGLFNVYIT